MLRESADPDLRELARAQIPGLEADVERLDLDPETPLSYLTQTTLSLDDTALRVPLPAPLDAKAYAEQWWDPSAGAHGRHRIQVSYGGSIDAQPSSSGATTSHPVSTMSARW